MKEKHTEEWKDSFALPVFKGKGDIVEWQVQAIRTWNEDFGVV